MQNTAQGQVPFEEQQDEADEMGSFQRVVTALVRKQPDRVPVFTYLNDDSSNISESLRDFILANTDVFYTERLHVGFMCTGLQPKVSVTPLQDGWQERAYTLDDGASLTEIYKQGSTGNYVGYSKHLISLPADLQRVLDLSIPGTRQEHAPGSLDR